MGQVDFLAVNLKVKGMIKLLNLKVKLILPVLLLYILLSCSKEAGSPLKVSYTSDNPSSDTIKVFRDSLPSNKKFDLQQIRKKGKLVALTGYSYNSYFLYRGTPLGYEYELLKEFTDHLGVKLEIKLVKDMENIFDKLHQGEGDIVADNLIITGNHENLVSFSNPYITTRQVLVQKKTTSPIRDILDLEQKVVHVRKNSPFALRLKNIALETAIKINIEEVGGAVETEELIRMVSSGEIEYTVADKHTASFLIRQYSNIDISTPVGLSQQIGWAMRTEAEDLRMEVNAWMAGMKRKTAWYNLYNKYFGTYLSPKKKVNCSRISTCNNKISPFDNLIMEASKRGNWDWRLITSIIYQESRFNAQAVSWAGATGLMQLMPLTADYFGVKELENPTQSILGGLRYLNWLDKYWQDEITDKDERIKFILASYNAGQEHVADARRLALKYGKNPMLWKEVSEYLLLKSSSKYYNDPIVRYGYCRGEEPVTYVEEILNRYEHYKTLIKDDIYHATTGKNQQELTLSH